MANIVGTPDGYALFGVHPVGRGWLAFAGHELFRLCMIQYADSVSYYATSDQENACGRQAADLCPIPGPVFTHADARDPAYRQAVVIGSGFQNPLAAQLMANLGRSRHHGGLFGERQTMQEVKMFMFEGCPHCRRARELLDEIFAEHPEYARVPFTVVDERIHPEIAEKFDYFYVPTFYVGSEKVMEGVPSKRAIERAFAKAAVG